MNEKRTSYQRGDTEVVSRSLLKEAVYNPRTIDKESMKRLQKGLKEHGLIGASIVWNRRTGTVVSGHQRLKALDVLEKGNPDYDIEVTVIDVDEKEEKTLNVQLNNPSMQGDWDLDKLGSLFTDDGLSSEALGFSSLDVDMLFGGDDRYSALFDDDAGVREAKDTLSDIKKDRAEMTEKLKEEQSADTYFTVFCESQAQKDEILKKIGVPLSETFVSAGAILRLERIGSDE